MSLWKGIVEIMTTPLPNPLAAWGYGSLERPKSGKRGSTTRRTAQGFAFEGTLTAGRTTQFAVLGRDLQIDEETWIFGELRLGSYAHVKGTLTWDDDKWMCTSITIA